MDSAKPALTRAAEAVPPQAWFGVSALFHYLGPSFAVLLFPAVGVLGVAWMRITSAALIFVVATRPWRVLAAADRRTRLLLLGLGVTLAAMNSAFYLALARLPMSLVATIEFVGVIGVAVWGLRTRRNFAALALAASGALLLTGPRWSDDRIGLAWALLNGALFVAYIVMGHRIANLRAKHDRSGAAGGVERLGAAMAIAAVAVTPIGFGEALASFAHPSLVLAGIGVGLCSSVIPYVCDQLAMSRLPRATFALLLALLPAIATLIGAVVLRQVPSVVDLAGIALVMGGVAIHQPPTE